MTNWEKAKQAFEKMCEELEKHPISDEAWVAVCDCIDTICALLPTKEN